MSREDTTSRLTRLLYQQYFGVLFGASVGEVDQTDVEKRVRNFYVQLTVQNREKSEQEVTISFCMQFISKR